jgi:hypothetical protein
MQSSAPRKQPEKKSLSDIFNHFANDAVERFPHLHGNFILVDTNDRKIYGHINEQKIGARSEAVMNYLQQNHEIQQLIRDPHMSSCAFKDPRTGLDIMIMKEVVKRDHNGVSLEEEKNLLFTMDHELAHLGVKDGMSGNSFEDVVLAECVADAYALIRHFQRFGDDSVPRHQYVDPFSRLMAMVMGQDLSHFTTFVLDEIIKRKDEIDFSKLDEKQTENLAWRFAMKFAPPKPVIAMLHEEFEPVRQAYERSPHSGNFIKVLISMALDPKTDYYTFKASSLLLKTYLEDAAKLSGKLNVPEELLKDVRKKLKEKEIKLAERDILFDIPLQAPKLPSNQNQPRI